MRKIISVVLSLLMISSLMVIGINASSSDPDIAEFYYGTPTVDGVIEEMWDSVPQYDVKYMTQGTGNPVGLTAYFKGMWDENYVYILAYVNDTTLNTAEQEVESWTQYNEFWQVDSHHFFFDFANGGSIDFKLEVMAYGQDRGQFSQYSDKYEYAHKTGSDYYFFEAKIAVKDFISSFKNEAGTEFRLDYQVNDNTTGDTRSREECHLWNDETGGSNGNASICGIGKLVAAAASVPEEVIEIIEDVTPAETPAAPADTAPVTTAPTTTAPQTSDPIVMFGFLMILAAAIMLTYKKIKN